MNRNFFNLLRARHEQDLRVCVGLDPVYEKIPDFVKKVTEQNRDTDLPIHADTFVRFCCAIISSTYDIVCAFKPNIAFFEELGPSGLAALKKIFLYIQIHAPDVPIILDAKRGDIGNTNDGYVKSAFDFFGADAITLSPYLGRESLEPFLKQEDKGCFILCRTSNPGAGEFQNRLISITAEEAVMFEESGASSNIAKIISLVDEGPVQFNATQYFVNQYSLVALSVSRFWNRNQNCAIVVGATAPEELANVRRIIGPDMPILIPGIGAQGGDIEKTVKAGGPKIIANLSRSVIYASSGEDFAKAARLEVVRVNVEIHKWL